MRNFWAGVIVGLSVAAIAGTALLRNTATQEAERVGEAVDGEARAWAERLKDCRATVTRLADGRTELPPKPTPF